MSDTDKIKYTCQRNMDGTQGRVFDVLGIQIGDNVSLQKFDDFTIVASVEGCIVTVRPIKGIKADLFINEYRRLQQIPNNKKFGIN